MEIDKIEMAINKLLESEASAYRIWKDTGIEKSAITRLRNGERSLDNYKWHTIKTLYEYAANQRA